MGSLVLHAIVIAVLIPLESRDPPPAPINTTAQFVRQVDLTPPDDVPEPELEILERPEEPEIRDELVPPPEEPDVLVDEWDEADADELRDRVNDTIFCPDPRAASGRFRPSRRRAEPEPAAPEPTAGFGTVPVRRPPAAEPPRPPAPTPATIVAHVSPRYPRTARERGIEGVVTLRVVVEAAGDLGEITIVRSSGSALLDRAAIAAVEEWEFRPATVRGIAVRSTLDLPAIRFRLTD